MFYNTNPLYNLENTHIIKMWDKGWKPHVNESAFIFWKLLILYFIEQFPQGLILGLTYFTTWFNACHVWNNSKDKKGIMGST